MLKTILTLAIMTISITDSYRSPAVDEFYEFGEGTAYNYTARQGGDVKMHLSSSDKKSFKAVIFWDNQKLFGTATVCGSHAWTSDEYIRINFEGLFDCSGIAGWPENTSSPFTADVHYFVNKNEMEGTYVINGAGRLPFQHGHLKVSFGKTPFDLGLIGEFPCDEPDIDSDP